MQNPNMISEDIHASFSFFHDKHLIAKMPEASWDSDAKYTDSQGHRRGPQCPSNLGVKSIRKILRCQKPEIQPILLVNNCRFECTP
jgi:hypothetical protein